MSNLNLMSPTKDNKDINDKIKYLYKASFFSSLNNDQLRELAQEFQWLEYSPGSELIRQGEITQYFYVLTEGRVESIVYKEGHDPLQLNTFGPGDAFGEIALLTGNPAASTLKCVTKCKILV